MFPPLAHKPSSTSF